MDDTTYFARVLNYMHKMLMKLTIAELPPGNFQPKHSSYLAHSINYNCKNYMLKNLIILDFTIVAHFLLQLTFVS